MWGDLDGKLMAYVFSDHNRPSRSAVTLHRLQAHAQAAERGTLPDNIIPTDLEDDQVSQGKGQKVKLLMLSSVAADVTCQAVPGLWTIWLQPVSNSWCVS